MLRTEGQNRTVYSIMTMTRRLADWKHRVALYLILTWGVLIKGLPITFAVVQFLLKSFLNVWELFRMLEDFFRIVLMFFWILWSVLIFVGITLNFLECLSGGKTVLKSNPLDGYVPLSFENTSTDESSAFICFVAELSPYRSVGRNWHRR